MIIKESHSAQTHREAKERDRGLPSQSLLDTSDPHLRVRQITEERPDLLADLVARFSKALLDKLRAAEKKYGYDDAWTRSDWQEDLNTHLHKHLAKGDPRDVAAYCAFAWHHGWSLTPSEQISGEAVERVTDSMVVAAAYAIAERDEYMNKAFCFKLDADQAEADRDSLLDILRGENELINV